MGKNKTLKALGEIFGDIMDTISVLTSDRSQGSEATGTATYGTAVSALTKRRDMSSFYKNEIMEILPKKADSALYEAAIAVIEDDEMSGFYKLDTIIKIFEGS